MYTNWPSQICMQYKTEVFKLFIYYLTKQNIFKSIIIVIIQHIANFQKSIFKSIN